MAKNKLYLHLKEYVGAPVEYTKYGSRNGWQGVIQEVNQEKATVLFDNGVEQTYSLMAVYTDDSIKAVYKEIGQQHYKDFECTNDMYIRVTSRKGSPNKAVSSGTFTGKALPQKCYLIVNMSTGEVVGTETDESEAETFAYDQAMSSTKRENFTVFAPRSRFAIKQPLVEKLTSLFK